MQVTTNGERLLCQCTYEDGDDDDDDDDERGSDRVLQFGGIPNAMVSDQHRLGLPVTTRVRCTQQPDG